MKGKFAILLVLLLVFIAGCNVVPPGTPFEQVEKPQYTPTPGTYDSASIEVSINSATPGASIFYTVDGTLPQELQDWLTSLEALNTQVSTSAECGEIYYALEQPVIDDLNNWIVQANLGIGGGLSQEDVASCSQFFASMPPGSAVDLATILANVDQQTVSACNNIFIFLEQLVASDVQGWQDIIQYDVDTTSILSCSAIFADVASAFDTAVSTLLYVGPFTITDSTTIKAVAYQDGMWPSDISTAVYTLSGTGNQAPQTALTSPSPGSLFTDGQSIGISATASDSDGSISWVEFWADNDATFIGQDTSAPYSTTWNGASIGVHTIRSKAFDNEGASAYSSPVSITVEANTNNPPTVSIKSPANGDELDTGTITVTAEASDSDGTIQYVEFFRDGSILIGNDSTDSGVGYSIDWPNVGAGAFVLTARAVDNEGASTISSPVSITVVSPSGNIFPTANITSPANGSSIDEGIVVTISADASDLDGTIERVEFLKNGSVEGNDTSSPYTLSWTALIGDWVWTAKAYDNLDANGVSDPVYISVVPVTPPDPFCGDNICNGVESCSTCGTDCGSCGGGRRRSSGGSPPSSNDDDDDDSGPSNTIKTIIQAKSTRTTTDNSGGDATGTQQPPELKSTSDESKGLGFWLYIIILVIVGGAIFAFFVLKKRRDEHLQNPGIPPESMEQCRDYITKMKILGKTQDQIRTKMNAGGWTNQQMDYIFSQIK